MIGEIRSFVNGWQKHPGILDGSLYLRICDKSSLRFSGIFFSSSYNVTVVHDDCGIVFSCRDTSRSLGRRGSFSRLRCNPIETLVLASDRIAPESSLMHFSDPLWRTASFFFFSSNLQSQSVLFLCFQASLNIHYASLSFLRSWQNHYTGKSHIDGGLRVAERRRCAERGSTCESYSFWVSFVYNLRLLDE